MIRHAKLFETAGHQLLIQVAAMECACTNPSCPGLTLGVSISVMGQFPRGLGLLRAQCGLMLPPDRLCQLVDGLGQDHARHLLEVVQATAYKVNSDEDARIAIEAMFLQLHATVPM
ncbi:hypothetical protein BXP70_27825 [Hymenobacter crusticola]|uniref:Uncharacterized protein n=1 Tax=Hymenobacter crusticola TaxID=1770526 RepID=A0A243W5S8_9BACT|nr:hypothetical protein BXP70_27825 [Hymenobacter crusticola]